MRASVPHYLKNTIYASFKKAVKKRDSWSYIFTKFCGQNSGPSSGQDFDAKSSCDTRKVEAKERRLHGTLQS